MQQIFPYQTFAGDFNLRARRVLIDDDSPGVDPVVPSARIIDFSVLEQDDWRFATVEFVLDGPAGEVQEWDGDLNVVAEAFCGPTNMRQTLALEPVGADPARWTGSIDLDRLNFAGKVEVRALVAGTVDDVPNRFLAESDAWSIHFDEPEIPAIEGTLRIQWLDFESDDGRAIVGEANAEEAYFPDLEASVPILYLNSSFNGLPGLLDDRRRTDPAERAAHELERMAVAVDVWGALFNASAAAVVVPDGEEPDWPEAEWQEKVLKALLPRVYESNLGEALRSLVEDRSSADAARGLQARALMAIGTQLKSGRAIRRAVQQLDRREVSSS